MSSNFISEKSNTKILCVYIGPVAQRIRRLTTDQEIAGSNPAGIVNELYFASGISSPFIHTYIS